MTKKSYETPVVTDHGTLSELTAQTQVGQNLDANFPSGTPLNQVTLS